MKTLQTVLTGIKKTPGKTLMTLLAVGLGVGVLISSLNISGTFSTFIDNELTKDGIILNVANAEYSDEGGLERVRPPEFDEYVIDILKSEVPGVSAVSPNVVPFFDLQLKAEGTTYRIRSLLGVNEEYLGIMDLDIIAGSAFTRDDVESGEKKAVISEALAKTIFGSAENALGSMIMPPQTDSSGSGDSDSGESGAFRRRMVPPSYTIVGVYETPSELKRKAYGIGDALVPYLALLPSGMNVQMAKGFLLSTLAVSVSDSTLASAESQIRGVLAGEYGDDISVHVWEGTPRGEESVLEGARKSLSTMTVVINLLGFILLITGSIGILSIMIVEVAGRSREIAMKRALGAHKKILVGEFRLRAVVLSLVSGALGVVLSLVFLEPLRNIVIPIFSDIKMDELSGSIFQPVSVVIGLGTAVVFGGVFGILPIFSALKTPIAEGIREV